MEQAHACPLLEREDSLMTFVDAATAVCLECGKRFTRAFRGSTRHRQRRHTGGLYCSAAHRQIGYRRRRAIEQGRTYHAASLRKRPRRKALNDSVRLTPSPHRVNVTLGEIRKDIQDPASAKKRYQAPFQIASCEGSGGYPRSNRVG